MGQKLQGARFLSYSVEIKLFVSHFCFFSTGFFGGAIVKSKRGYCENDYVSSQQKKDFPRCSTLRRKPSIVKPQLGRHIERSRTFEELKREPR